MTRSRLIVIAWIILTITTLGLYVRALIGTSIVALGPLQLEIDSSVVICHNERSEVYLVFLDWDSEELDPFGSRPQVPNHLFHWDQLHFWRFESDRDPFWGDYLLFPLWFPYAIATCLLLPFFTHARRRENKARTDVLFAPED